MGIGLVEIGEVWRNPFMIPILGFMYFTYERILTLEWYNTNLLP